MFYCPGEYCSKRNGCFHYMPKHQGRNLQLLDMSTQGFGRSGVDEHGNYFSHHEYECGDRAPAYKSFKPIETWQDKGNWENYNSPAHAEGWPCIPGSLILIEDENGEEKVIPFEPETLKLGTKVLDWHYWQRKLRE